MPSISIDRSKLRRIYSLDEMSAIAGRIAWSPNGRDIALPISTGAVHVWDTALRERRQVLSDFIDTTNEVAWSPDGSALACACTDGAIRIWEPERNRLRIVHRGHTSEARSVSWSPDGRLLASSGADATIRVWGAEGSHREAAFSLDSYFVNCVRWSYDGNAIAAADGGGKVQIWNVISEVPKILEGHKKFVVSIAWSPRRDCLVSASYDNTIRVWDAESGRLQELLRRHRAPVTSVCFDNDGSHLASKSLDGTVRLWDCWSWEESEVINEPTPDHWAPGIAFHPQEPLLATLGTNGRGVRVWAPPYYEPGMRKLRAFLCHSSGDKPVVAELYRRLHQDGIAPWLDKESLLPGQDWRLEIEKAVNSSDAIIVCLSRESVTKEGYVQREIKYALELADEKPEGTIFIIPVRLEACDVPRRLQRWHWVDFFTPAGYDSLLRGLRERARTLGLRLS